MIIRIATLLLLSNFSCLSQAKVIDHLVPPSGLHDFESSWEYDVKLRKILLADAPAKPIAFALVRAGRLGPEYCVSLIRIKKGEYVIEFRQAERRIDNDTSNAKNEVSVYRSSNISLNKALEIEKLWRGMLRGVRHITPEERKGMMVVTGGSSTYYAGFVFGEGILAGETPSLVLNQGAKLSKMSSMVNWMREKCISDNKDKILKNVNKQQAEQVVAPDR